MEAGGGGPISATLSPLNASEPICLMLVPAGARAGQWASEQFGATAAAQRPSSPPPLPPPSPELAAD